MMEDWVECTLGDICIRANKVRRKEMILSKTIKYIDIGGIDNKLNEIISFKEFSWETAPSRAQQIIKVGDILFSTVRTYLKNIARVKLLEYDNEICSSGFTVIRGRNEVILSVFLFHYSLSTSFLNSLSKLQTGSSYPAVRDKDVFNQKISLPPLPIQRAIVAKIESLFSSLDAGIADLKKAQKQLKVYRQAVLKKAFEGELTKEWRESQTDLPTAEELLEEIKVEREKYYEKRLKEWEGKIKAWEENGKEGKKPAKPKRNKTFSLSVEILKQLPILPKCYCWICFGNSFQESPQNGIYKPSTEYGSGIPIIRIDNFYDGVILEQSGFKRVRLAKKEVEKYRIREGQILINRVNSIEYLGKCGRVKKLIEDTVFESNIMKISVLESILHPVYLQHYLTSGTGIKEIRRFAKHAVNQASINQADVTMTPIPLCTLKEQKRVVNKIESRLSVCNQLEKDIKESLQKSEALRQGILKKAFEGKLLTKVEIERCKQEADYEPAAVLLERIKKEKLGKLSKAKN